MPLPQDEQPTTTFSGGLAWEVIDPDGNARLNSNQSPDGHPSITGSKQTGAAAPVQETKLAKNIANLYVGQECVVRKVPSAEADDRLVELIRERGAWIEP